LLIPYILLLLKLYFIKVNSSLILLKDNIPVLFNLHILFTCCYKEYKLLIIFNANLLYLSTKEQSLHDKMVPFLNNP